MGHPGRFRVTRPQYREGDVRFRLERAFIAYRGVCRADALAERLRFDAIRQLAAVSSAIVQGNSKSRWLRAAATTTIFLQGTAPIVARGTHALPTHARNYLYLAPHAVTPKVPFGYWPPHAEPI